MPLVLHTRVVTGAGGGPDKTILNSPRFLSAAGYRVMCAYMRAPRDPGFAELERRARQWGAPLLAVDDGGPLDWRLPGRFHRICREHQPAIWHAHDYKSNALGLMLRRRHPMRLVTTVHGWVKHTWKTPLYYRVDKLCLPYYDAVICVSPDLYEQCRALGVSAQRCWHVPNAIDLAEYRRTRPVEDAKARLGVPAGRMVIGAVGRLSAEKGYPLLVQALGELRREGVDAELWIVGEGDQRRRLETLVRRLALSERVRLLGYRADTIDLYEAMDVFASSSLREGLPNVVLEAMALGLAVVCTRVAGVPQVIRSGEEGLVVRPGSVAELTEGLRRLLGDSATRRRLGSAARRAVQAGYGLPGRMERIRAIYDGALAAGEAAA